MSNTLHETFIQQTVTNLKARGTVVIPPSAGPVLLFSANDARTKVATAVHPDTLASVFTRGDLTLSDNFDADPRRTKPVENCTFGAAKLLLEKHHAAQFLSPAWTAERVRSKLADFAAVDGKTLDEALAAPALFLAELQDSPHDLPTRRTFLARLMWRQLAAVDAAVFAWASKSKKHIRADDPVLALCRGREATLALLRESLAGVDDYDRVAKAYFGVREALLPALLDGNPRFAKLAVGRKVLFPLLDDLWHGKNGAPVDLSVWSVAIARSAQLGQHADLAYAFVMAQTMGHHTETSDCDDLWAVQVQGGDDGPLQALGAATVEAREAFWAEIAAKTPTRKLGVANALAARRLLGVVEADEAAALEALTACGWVAWFEAHVAPMAWTLPAELVEALRAAGAPEVRAFWERLAASLERAPARSSTGASC